MNDKNDQKDLIEKVKENEEEIKWDDYDIELVPQNKERSPRSLSENSNMVNFRF
jgi:hypothetical protein